MSTFGLVPGGPKKRPGSTRFTGGRRLQQANNNKKDVAGTQQQSAGSSDAVLSVDPFEQARQSDAVDARMGYARFNEGPSRIGWLANMQPTIVPDPEWHGGRSAVDFYFIQDDGATFKATLTESPYFLIACKPQTESDVESYLRRKFDTKIEFLARIQKEDLDLPNHLLGYRRTYIKIGFRNVDDLMEVRRVIMPVIKRNQDAIRLEETYTELMANDRSDDEDGDKKQSTVKEGLDYIIDIREYDVPYIARVAIDHNYRVGLWYSVREANGKVEIERQHDKVLPAEPVVFAFDIETTKAPLKFPDRDIDQIMMISYMVDRQGYLITNREIVSEDIENFEYSPKPGEYDGPFIVFNEADEKALLERFFEHIRDVRPGVFVTYNGDFFDWPYVDARAKLYSIDMFQEIGVYKNDQDEYTSAFAAHMDCFRWVKRDSYLPVGSQGLKAVTKAKLGYDPKELDPELMTRYASECPSVLADYSVSDAVATYYLYMKYVHPFVFSLCNIIPMAPDDVLRKGSGTLCEMLLMVEAYRANVVMPNKHVDDKNKLYEGHLLESETYVGGHVEALESGVFRSDFPTYFRLVPDAFQKLIDDVDKALQFSIEVEEKTSLDKIANYDDIRNAIVAKLEDLRDTPNRKETPLIYHLDVAAMYPNIILTNRLQPPALVKEETCAACDFNRPGATCQRRMTWSWRGEFFPAQRNEYNMIRNQLESEKFPSKKPGEGVRSWTQLTENEKNSLLHKRLGDYSRKVYKKIRDNKVEERESIVCQRENSFYVDTVRNFRDRRYEYKGKLKTWKKNLDIALDEKDPSKTDEARKMIVLMDSLQLAHKCILNSFYGYVMRKGSRWYSMEMAGIVCLTGAKIIQMAREIVEQIGRPLELDTDGIWCILPSSFPENFSFETINGKKITISYPCVMLNHLVHSRFTNHQYQVLKDPDTHTYETRSENSIFFEVDGPYKAMILPSSTEEGKLLKKRYAVFDENDKLVELKGFEIKRRGELKIIKIFQEEVFKVFLHGSTLEECYAAVGKVAERWLDILTTKGANTSDEELLEYISENRSMSKTLEDYGSQKSTSISTAKRLAEFLGDQMVKDKGLACHFIIASKPIGAPVAERAIPVAIFSAEESVKKHFLRKWLKDSSLTTFEIRDILDWTYYIDRLSSTIQKLITIPAAMQKVSNPIPRVQHPDWLLKRSTNKLDEGRQRRITDMFQKTDKSAVEIAMEQEVDDIENIGVQNSSSDVRPVVQKYKRPKFMVGKKKVAEIVEEINENAVVPDLNEDYAGWLAHKKKVWRIRRKQRKQEAREMGFDRRQIGTMSGFLQNQTRGLMRHTWEVIQIAETDIPGEFRLWALVDRNLHSVRIKVPRVFYVNCREPDPRGIFQKITKRLPRSLPMYHLYEFTVYEEDYQKQSDIYRSFTWHHETAGVFETNVPLSFRALLHLGCTIGLDVKSSHLARKSNDDAYHVDDFLNKRSVAPTYLSQGKMNYIFLYHSQTDTRHMIGMFLPALGKNSVFVIDPYRNEAMPNISRYYKERRERYQSITSDQFNIFNYPDNLEVSVSHFRDEKSAMRALQKALSDYQHEKHGPTTILLQSPKQSGMFASNVRILNEFPVIAVPCDKKDNLYPALDWQKFASRRMVAAFLYARDWLADRIVLARNANAPIGNIENDSAAFLSDLTLARSLHEQDMILWYSSTERPDLGGREEDDNFTFLEEIVDPQMSAPGAYGTICIEYEIDNLAMNTVLQSTFINELEGADGYAGLSNADMSTIDEHIDKQCKHDIIGDINAPSFQAFKCLKDLVKTWTKELHIYSNPIGRVLLTNFYRWLSSPSSKMFEPSLYGYIHSLMKKTLMQLLAEFKRLGSKIVYADFNKIVIVTSKTSFVNAEAYNKFIVKAIAKKESFMMIELKTINYWEYLIWMDTKNYGGIVADAAVEGEDEGDGPSMHMNWNIKSFLPPLIQQQFDVLIGEFIALAHRHKKHERSNRHCGETPVKGIPRNVTMSQFKEQSTDMPYEEELIKQNFMRKLLEIIPEIQSMMNSNINDEDRASLTFPKLPGMNSNMDHPALELIKFVCKVFSLAPGLEEPVRILKASLLKLLGVREFSPEAQFSNPCEPLVLRHIICGFCQHCRDLDLCRDPELTVDPENPNSISMWSCPHCEHEYEKSMIEEHLVELARRTLMAYQVQDLECSKCGKAKVENVRNTCKQCAEKFHLGKSAPIRPEEFAKTVKTLHSIALTHRMSLLAEVIDFIGTK